jgi:hydrogenase/urease accessory protein HupE
MMHSGNPGQAALLRLAGLPFARGTILVLLFSVLPLQETLAHDPGLSSLTIRQRPDRVEAALTLAVKDAAQLIELDDDHDGRVTQAEFARARSRLETALARQLVLASDGKVAKAHVVRSHLDGNNNVEVDLHFQAADSSSLEVQSRLIASLPLGHRQYLQVQNSAGEPVLEKLLSAATDRATAQFAANNAKVSTRETGNSFTDFVVLGVKHILTGYDHLLFLFALLVVARGFISSLSIITSFTIAHSITLAAATFNVAQIPSRVIEPLIAASIIFVGVENLLHSGVPKARQVATFGFGLIHGFGFASVLREMGLGAGTGGVALPLFSFNLGVEIGQIMVAAVALPVIWKLRANPLFIARWAPACSAAVVLLGSFWFVERICAN